MPNFTLPYEIAFFWVGQDTTIPNYLVKSARKVYNDTIKISQLTDLKTPPVIGIDHIYRQDLPPEMMTARLISYEEYPYSNEKLTYFCDADSLILKPLNFLEPTADLYLVKRPVEYDDLINHKFPEVYPEFKNKQASEVMPIMFGAMAIKSGRDFFASLSATIKKLPDRFHRWYGDQYALSILLKNNPLKYKDLPADKYLFCVGSDISCEQITKIKDLDIRMVTFKGPDAKRCVPELYNQFFSEDTSDQSMETKDSSKLEVKYSKELKTPRILDVEKATNQRLKMPLYNDLGLQELIRLPQFFDWVTCNVSETVSFEMFLGGADDGVALRFFWNGSFEKASMLIWSELSKSSSNLILDIGSHTGAYTLASMVANPDSTVVSFEPFTPNYLRQKLNLRGNKLPDGNIFNFGVGDKHTELEFFTSTPENYLTSGGSFLKSNSATESVKVTSVSLDTFLEKKLHSLIDLIKIDTEGFESKCLRGMQEIIRKSHPTLIFECITDEINETFKEILLPFGYKFYEIDEKQFSIKKTENLVPLKDGFGKINLSQTNRLATAKHFDIINQIKPLKIF